MKFKELNLNNRVLTALDKNNFSKATEIQQKAIPMFLENKNVFGKSSTGTGKTAAFVLPILNNINCDKRVIQAIIMAPTRELAMQIVTQIRIFGVGINNLTITPLIGGTEMREQVKKMKQSQIVVGTPGRVNDHINRKNLKLENVNTIILDEADEMLKMGFKNEMDAIFEQISPDSQVGLFSATVTPKVLSLAKKYMNEYEMIEIENQIEVNNNITNTFIFTKNVDKKELLKKVFELHKPKKAIIFSNTKNFTDKIADVLYEVGLKSVVINGDKRQSQRSRSINAFKNGQVNILVATDVVARGIDISDVDYVINYDISRENEHFVHRIGRTGRNNKKGDSITFVDNMGTMRQLKDIQKEFNIEVNEIEISEYNIERKQQTSFSDRNANSRSRNDRSSKNSSSSRSGGSRDNRGSRDSRSATRSNSGEARSPWSGSNKSGGSRSTRGSRDNNNSRDSRGTRDSNYSRDSSSSRSVNYSSRDNKSRNDRKTDFKKTEWNAFKKNTNADWD
ncbi:DEAD-box ATP-dependent RNA helicase [Entomoplasma ellychniae]|uniref:DEAD-box ATP-dependent RNA helicase n=1 Tax=Entomoplasma ellychniae TaxID=2114 RepID=A0A8E2QVI1_9MOLU|nr:DEAD/DEAH box helicase [Entomoplasma ellychniae]PPE04452.1 DEAD-box ATP-dependent RNA helicase [Entomoplasma ellychniae]